MALCSRVVLQTPTTTGFSRILLHTVFHLLIFPVSSRVKNKPCDRLADLPKQSYGTPNILNVSETAGSRKSSVGITTGTWTETALR
jgi:hypothetical protein